MSKDDFLPLPPEQAIKFFKSKGYKIGFDWRDVWKEEHGLAFTVAKATSVDLLQDIRNALQESLENGTTFETFKKQLKPILVDKGWWGCKEMTDPLTGETKEVQLGSTRRLSVIYDTNMRMSYAAGHWDDIEKNAADASYLQYICVMDDRTREDHARWNGLVLRYDDPFWNTHYPPNGWRCRCSVLQMSDFDLQQRGLKVGKAPEERMRSWKNNRTGETMIVPEGIAPGFDYNVGRSRLKAFTPPPEGGLPATFQNRTAELPPLPKPSPLPKDALLPEGLPDAEYVKAFLQEFGADIGKGAVFEDVAGEPLTIDMTMFVSRTSGKIKVNKNDSGQYMKLLARSIMDPDEIWMGWEVSQALKKDMLRRRYIKIWEAGKGSYALSVFEKGKDGWTGLTSFPARQENIEEYLNKQRDGFLAYKKPSGR